MNSLDNVKILLIDIGFESTSYSFRSYYIRYNSNIYEVVLYNENDLCVYRSDLVSVFYKDMESIILYLREEFKHIIRKNKINKFINK